MAQNAFLPGWCKVGSLRPPLQHRGQKKGHPMGSLSEFCVARITRPWTSQRSCRRASSWTFLSCLRLVLAPCPWSSNRQTCPCCTSRPWRRQKHPTCCSIQQTCPCCRSPLWRRLKQITSSSILLPCPCCKTPFWHPSSKFAPSWPCCRQELPWTGQTPSMRRRRMLRGKEVFS